MDSPTTSKRNDHDGDGELVGPRSSTQLVIEMLRSQSSSGQGVMDSMLSDEFTDKFNGVLDELPKGDSRRAEVLFIVGGQFNLERTRTASPILLDKAISYTERALEELPKPHKELEKYVVVYTNLLQQKVEKSNELGVAEHVLEATNQYISGIKLGIRYLEECSLKEEKKYQLGCAYWTRFGQFNDMEDLALAIETLEACFENLEKVSPEAAIYLGSALCQRYDHENNPDDLDRSVELLRKGLETVPRDKDHHAPMRAYGLGVLTSTCERINNDPCSSEIRSRAISSVEMVLSSTPPGDEAVRRLKKQYLDLVMVQYFKEPESVQELLETLKFGLDDKLVENQDNMEAVELPPTMNKLFTLVPLSDNKKNIRLLKLLPGKRNDFIQCEILVERLGGDFHYEALSYVWGSPTETAEICVDGCLHKVTKNLYSALLRLRHIETARTLWIDALCINQRDLIEKRHQIGLMRRIYQNASTVIMWLGEPESEYQPFVPKVGKVDQASGKHLTSPTREQNVKFDKAEVATENELSLPEHLQMQRSVSDVPVQPLSLEQFAGSRELEVLTEKFKWLKPTLFGCKTVSKASNEGFPEFTSMAENLVKKIEQEQRVNLLFHNNRFRHLPGPELHVFDWTSPDNIISFFRSPQSASMWPALGAFTLIHSFAQLMHFSKLPFFRGTDTDLSYPSKETFIKSASELDRILSLEYWKRAWILQEVVLARKPIIHYGPHVMHLDELLRASHVFEVHYNECCSKWGDKAYRKSHTYWTKLGSGFKKFKKLYLLRCAHGAPSMFSSDSPSSKSNSRNALSNRPNSILSLSSIMRTGIAVRRATDPRDLVYGILGLVDGDIDIEADYTASLPVVFARAAVHMIQEEHSLQALTLNDFGRHTKDGLPSWVPDWTSDGMFCPQPYSSSLYKADGGQHYFAEIENELKLKVRSVKVDTIKRVSKMRTVSWNNPSELVGLLKEWRNMAGLDLLNQLGGHDHADLEDTFWRAVFADVISEHEIEHKSLNDQQEDRDRVRRFEPRDMAKVRAWWDWLQREAGSNPIGLELEWHSLRTLPNPDGFQIVTDSFWSATETRKMIFAERGGIGTGPSEFGNYIEFGDARAGDEVHVLLGLSVPVILRVLEEREGEECPSAVGLKRYKFVGPCYLHGVMDGKAVENGNEMVEEILLC